MERVEGAMRSRDGTWRVDVVRDGRARWYRLTHPDGEVSDRLTLATVRRLLSDAGADLGTFVPVRRLSGR